MSNALHDAPPLPPWLQPKIAALARDLAGFDAIVPQGMLASPLLRMLGDLAAKLPGGTPSCATADAPPIVSAFAPLVLLADGDAVARVTGMPEEKLRTLRAGRGLVVFDGSNEGRVFARQYVANIHRALEAHGIPAGRAVWIQQNQRLERVYVARFGRPGSAPLRILSGHMHAAEMWRGLVGHRKLHWRFGFALEPQGPRRHRWICLNNNLRPHRALLVTWLLGRREPGFLSFSAAQELRVRVDRARLLQAVRRFAPDEPDAACRAVERLLDKGEHHSSDIDTFTSPDERIYTLPVAEVAAAELFIVTETEMANPGLLRWTEKTLKAIGSGLPIVVFGNPGVIAALRRIGFDLLDDLVDHTYDSVLMPSRRFAAAKAAVERFLARPPGFTAAEMARLHAASVHNRRIFLHAILRHSLLNPLERLVEAARG
ncbi:hypothetical protein [Roseomonas fluvialis]|uniref:Uncharacterized protein n=1 Tax=Roseomonas fluvialis TaxID=1750527 RepID=A0ABN6P2Z5_9PROT|nr:hypothetical protein [Roseomonas fluvialis]BDG73037.1 hypothetical protein Rmf_29660 [Roseomonas fluvialis]